MDLRVQEYLVAIQKYGNMTEAAEKLFITPSALNQQLLKLEKALYNLFKHQGLYLVLFSFFQCKVYWGKPKIIPKFVRNAAGQSS